MREKERKRARERERDEMTKVFFDMAMHYFSWGPYICKFQRRFFLGSHDLESTFYTTPPKKLLFTRRAVVIKITLMWSSYMNK